MGTLTTWGGNNFFVNGQQVRVIVATTTKKRAAELLGISLYELNSYFSATGNAGEIDTAEAAPETVFYNAGTFNDRDYVEYDDAARDSQEI